LWVGFQNNFGVPWKKSIADVFHDGKPDALVVSEAREFE
jgi:hypothetical protein